MTLITESMHHNPTLTLCHRLATTMPKPFPYLSITVVVFTDGEELFIDCIKMLPFPLEIGPEECCRFWKMISGSTVIQETNGFSCKGQLRWPEGPPQLALNPPYYCFKLVFFLIFVVFVFVLFFPFFSS